MPAMLRGNVANQFHDQKRLAHTGAAEQADFSAAGEGCQEVYAFDSGFVELNGGHLLIESRWGLMNGVKAHGRHGPFAVDRVAAQVQHATKALLANGNAQWCTGVDDIDTPWQSARGRHGNGTYHVLAKVFSDFQRNVEAMLRIFDAQCIMDGRQLVAVKFNIDHWADDMDHSSVFSHKRFPPLSSSISVVMLSWRSRR